MGSSLRTWSHMSVARISHFQNFEGASKQPYHTMPILCTVRMKKKGNPYSKAHCSKLNLFEYLHVAYISKEQLILFPLVPFLYHVCHAWPSTLPLKMRMSLSTFCKFCDLDKCVIAKQCNGVAAENVTSHARRSLSFLEISGNNRVLANTPRDLEDHLVVFDMDVWAIIWLWWDRTCRICGHRCQLSSEISGGYVEDVGA